MKRLLRLVLIFSALSGFFGQAMAFAQVPHRQAAEQQVARADDCMEAMTAAKPEKQGGPCKDITLDCIAAMGCVVPMILGEPTPLESAACISDLPLWVDFPLLRSGRSFAPDPDPPSLI